MKIVLTFTFVTLFISLSPAQKPVFEWMRTAQGSSWDEASAIACDNSGNSIATGYFEGSFNIGDSTFNTGTYADIFLIKHNSEGALEWAKQFSCERGAHGNSVLLDEKGNSILTGVFSDSVRINNHKYYGYLSQTGFIAKFDPDGNIVWFNMMDGEDGYIWPADMVFLSTGNIVCSGTYHGTVTIGDSVITTDDDGTFLVQYSPTGEFIKLIEPCTGTINDVDLLGIASDNMDNIFIGGNFLETLTFPDTGITSKGYHDIFIAKFDNQGNFLWARQEGGNYSDLGIDVASDQQGNAVITGYFSGSVTIGDTTVTALGSEEIIIIKYDPEGRLLWVRTAGGNVQMALDEANGIAADNNGNFFLTGCFEGSASFGDTTLISSGSTDLFCTKYDPDGNCVWAAKVGGSGEEWGDDIAINSQGDIYLTGWYTSTITFGDTIITGTDRTDVCVIKLSETEISSINKKPNYVNQFKLHQNYPNPFNPVTDIRYQVGANNHSPVHVELCVYNILGQKVALLVSERQQLGQHQVQWDAAGFPSGIYYYQLVAGEYRAVKKMILIK